jgi:hypothetical protein
LADKNSLSASNVSAAWDFYSGVSDWREPNQVKQTRTAAMSVRRRVVGSVVVVS